MCVTTEKQSKNDLCINVYVSLPVLVYIYIFTFVYVYIHKTEKGVFGLCVWKQIPYLISLKKWKEAAQERILQIGEGTGKRVVRGNGREEEWAYQKLPNHTSSNIVHLPAKEEE